MNSSVPQILHSKRAVTVTFNEELFDNNSVRVMFSSNCTDPVTVDYRNPVLISIPDTGSNIGLCSYIIQLVDGNLQQIGYQLHGIFLAKGIDTN